MSRTASRLLIALVAIAHAAFFIAYQRPDWATQWTDQNGYLLLGRVLAATGRFTRFAAMPQYVPESIRTPLYPAFVAVIDTLFGESRLAITVAQAGLFVLTCLLVYGIARMIASDGVALAAGLVVALYPPLPYFAALVLTETLTTFLVTAAIALWLTALRRESSGLSAASGIVLACAALTRPTFALLPIFLAVAALLAASGRRPWRASAVMIAAFAAAVAPWLLYNAIYFGALTFSPAGGPGRQLFEGTWQMEFPGRVETELTSLADATPDRAELDRKVRDLAAVNKMSAEPMLRYAHQHLEIQHIWTSPTDPRERMFARIAADHEYLRAALENIRRHPLQHIWRRAWRGTLLLWATEIPIRYSDINRLPPWVIRAIWLPQVLLVVAAVGGVVVVVRNGRRTEAYVMAALIVYVTAVHTPLYSEARYSLPAKPMMLLLATAAAAAWSERAAGRGTRRLPPSQSHS
jgi:4-amino-4-deoxy-L-arabinose transferase-like glycosyltransferase